ncbi:MAG: hypothetical protein JW797_20560, partial [Bradymonadales bacterium]|nr:hypothetical protein [Bradymonadales bacterium]
DDGNECTDDSCDPATGCVATNNSDPCDDGLFCTTGESCSAGVCTGGAPTDCNDGVGCTVDSCNEVTTSCDNNPDNALCDDGDACTIDTCDPVSDCVSTPDPACGSTVCGNGLCEGNGEDCVTCLIDCRCSGPSCSKGCCGNGVCEGTENLSNCAVDCI